MYLELAVLAISLLILYHLFFEFREKNLPPGPRPWPIIGNVNLMRGENLYLRLTELGKTYGKIFRLYIGHKPAIVLSGDAIKEALVRQSNTFAGRPSFRVISLKPGEKPKPEGLATTEFGPKWRLHRKLGHSSLKVYGEARLQKVIRREVHELTKRLEELKGIPTDIALQCGLSVTNIICSQLFGSRYEIDDPEFQRLYEIHNALTRRSVSSSNLAQVFPVLRSFVPVDKETTKMRKDLEFREDIIRDKYRQHLATFDPENIRDYTDAVIKVKLEAEKEDKSTKQYLDEDSIVLTSLSTLFIAGSETTSTTLAWAFAFLLHNPEVQDRLHREIDQVVGREELPQTSQRKDLPVLEAFTAEAQRQANLVPLSVPHKTTTATTLLGYDIPKDTLTFTNLWSLHFDPSIWKDPFKFDVDRFLDSEGKFVLPPGGTLLPFGAGPRVCLGEVLARSELFMFLCGLLQQFEFVNPHGCPLPSLNAEDGLVLHPKDYKMCAKKR